MLSDKEIDDRLELLKEISPWPWQQQAESGNWWIVDKNEKDLNENKDLYFQETAPAFEDALIKRVRELEDSNRSLSLSRSEVVSSFKDVRQQYEKQTRELEAENKQLTAKVNVLDSCCVEMELQILEAVKSKDYSLLEDYLPPKEGKE